MKSLDACVVRGKEKQICDLMIRLAQGEILRADLCDSEASAEERRKEAIVVVRASWGAAALRAYTKPARDGCLGMRRTDPMHGRKWIRG